MRNSSLHSDQKGFASITIALVIILVLGLITIGFAQLSRREQTKSLDKQLATQAQYAAESGINDVVRNFASLNASYQPTDFTTCLSPQRLGNANPSLNDESGVSYSCALVNMRPKSLEYTNIPVNDSNKDSKRTVFDTNARLFSLEIGWDSADSTFTNYHNAGETRFTHEGWWNYFKVPGVLQVSITPLGGVNGYNRQSLINNTYTVILYPSRGAVPNPVYATGQASARVVSGDCSATRTPRQCTVTIEGLDGQTGPYLLSIHNRYNASDVTITGETRETGVPSPAVEFLNSQAIVDVTGKARDVLKRLQVRVPLSGSWGPNYALEAGDICKQLDTEPSNTQLENCN